MFLVVANCYGSTSKEEFENTHKSLENQLDNSKPKWYDYQACGVNKMLRFWKKPSGYICQNIEYQSYLVRQDKKTIPFLDTKTKSSLPVDPFILSHNSMGNERFGNPDTIVYFIDQKGVTYGIEYYNNGLSVWNEHPFEIKLN